jgi:WhiB family redox-sensing transcriptional regulator
VTSQDLGKLHPRYWGLQAACSGADTELFFPPRIKHVYDELAKTAKKHCNGENGRRPCPVRDQCLEWAITTDELFGIYGGMSHRERNALVRKRHRTAQDLGTNCTTRCIVCEEEEENGNPSSTPPVEGHGAVPEVGFPGETAGVA